MTLLTNVVDAGFLNAAPRLKVVANVAVGFNNIDVAACAERGVLVTNTPGVLTEATADLAMALILMVTRRLAEGERLIRSGQPWQWGMFMMLGTGLQGRRLGIIGMGAIGRALAGRARAFEMEVAYHSRRPVTPELEGPGGARWVALDELLASSDVVSVNCPYNAETHHLIDAAALGRIRRHGLPRQHRSRPDRARAPRWPTPFARRDRRCRARRLRARAGGGPRPPGPRQRRPRAPPGLGDARDPRRRWRPSQPATSPQSWPATRPSPRSADLAGTKGKPKLLGQTFTLTPDGSCFGLPAIYSLHAWLYKYNPAGSFAMWNPRVHCPPGDDADRDMHSA